MTSPRMRSSRGILAYVCRHRELDASRATRIRNSLGGEKPLSRHGVLKASPFFERSTGSIELFWATICFPGVYRAERLVQISCFVRRCEREKLPVEDTFPDLQSGLVLADLLSESSNRQEPGVPVYLKTKWGVRISTPLAIDG